MISEHYLWSQHIPHSCIKSDHNCTSTTGINRYGCFFHILDFLSLSTLPLMFKLEVGTGGTQEYECKLDARKDLPYRGSLGSGALI